MALYPRQNSRFAFDVQVYHLTMRHLSFIIQHCCLRCDIGVGLTTEYRATFEGLSLLSDSSARQSIPKYII